MSPIATFYFSRIVGASTLPTRPGGREARVGDSIQSDSVQTFVKQGRQEAVCAAGPCERLHTMSQNKDKGSSQALWVHIAITYG